MVCDFRVLHKKHYIYLLKYLPLPPQLTSLHFYPFVWLTFLKFDPSSLQKSLTSFMDWPFLIALFPIFQKYTRILSIKDVCKWEGDSSGFQNSSKKCKKKIQLWVGVLAINSQKNMDILYGWPKDIHTETCFWCINCHETFEYTNFRVKL